ncbi:MAG TPA: hypothetical protein DEB25_06125 [Desulfobulbaceae bacterium]|nr:hypothetical protein [Desulfobulbaceae bacterium]
MIIRDVLRAGLVCLLVLTLGGWLFYSPKMAWSVFAGGVLTLTSFALSVRNVKRLTGSVLADNDFDQQIARGKQETWHCIVGFFLRLAVMALVLFPLIKHRWVEIFGLVIGLSVVPLAISAVGVVMAGRLFLHGR